MSNRPSYIFISHSSKDKVFARRLDAALVGAGLDVFIDEREMRVGDSFMKIIHEALAKATHVVHVISEHSVQSPWVEDEIAIARARQLSGDGPSILPVLIDNVALPIAIRHIHHADFRKWADATDFIRACNHLLSVFGGLAVPSTA